MYDIKWQTSLCLSIDIADPESVENVIASIREKVGKVDILVNNAGFGIFQEFTEMKPETIRNMFEVNVLGMMVLTQQIALEMVDQRSGHIINVASMAGKIATPKLQCIRQPNLLY